MVACRSDVRFNFAFSKDKFSIGVSDVKVSIHDGDWKISHGVIVVNSLRVGKCFVKSSPNPVGGFITEAFKDSGDGGCAGLRKAKTEYF